MEKRWSHNSHTDSNTSKELSDSLGISEKITEILVGRGIETFDDAKKYFRPSLSELHDPSLMRDMDKAVLRITKAIQQNEKILIYGDYDVDGTTAVSLLFSYLRNITECIDYYIPDRYTEGYGVSIQGVDYANEIGAGLIVSLDCGIKAVDKVDYALENEIDFIICDHHRPGEKLPNAYAILDPKQDDCSYPYDELSGCAIGFKLVQALDRVIGKNGLDVFELLDLVAVSLACDIVPLTGENRILAYHGLKRINSSPRLGIKTLLNPSKGKAYTVTDLVFTVGPRINAAGRIEHGKKAVELLINENVLVADMAGKLINKHNEDRKDLDKKITLEALDMMENDSWYSSAKSTVVFQNDWHKGVIGIVASRLIENHYRPTIVLTESNGKVAGSARSVKGFDVYNAIDACSDVIEQFGGHKYAAGLTMKKENIGLFRQKFEEVVSETILPEQLIPEIMIDAEITLDEIDSKFYRIVEQMAPFGPKNMRPIFVTKGVMDSGYTRIVGSTGEHLKIDVTQPGTSARFSGIAFGMADVCERIKAGDLFDIAYQLELNEWNGMVSIQMKVKDIRFDAMDEL